MQAYEEGWQHICLTPPVINPYIIMKKLLFISAILLGTSAWAQHLKLEPGFKAGLNTSTFSSDNNIKYTPRIAYNVGVFTHIHLTPKLAIQPEAVFSAQGARYTSAGVDYASNFNYLNIPVMGQYMFGNGFRVQTGPQLGVLLDARRKELGSDRIKAIGPDHRNFDFAWGVGASYLSSSGLGADARVTLGITNISAPFADNPVTNMRNNTIQVGLFYQFKAMEEPERE
jgi:hypothetical protein